MSRVFDGLRQQSRENSSNAAAEPRLRDSGILALQVPQDVLENLETVHCHIRPQNRLVGCGQDHDLGAEQFRFLRHRLDQLRQRRSLSKVLVTSTVPKEGKTVVATNLALSLARSSPRVALVDADMRQPGVHHALGLESLPGLAEFLEGRLNCAKACIRRLDPLGFYYVPAGRASTNPFELLQGPRMREFIETMAAAFDWIILDSPPLIPFADTHCLATLSDTILLVVRPGVTPEKELQQALAGLDRAQVAGVVLNASNDRQDRYYYYYPSAQTKAPEGAPPSKRALDKD